VRLPTGRFWALRPSTRTPNLRRDHKSAPGTSSTFMLRPDSKSLIEMRNLAFGRPMAETRNAHREIINLNLGRDLPFSSVNGSAAE
jgi:hypothetical protein